MPKSRLKNTPKRSRNAKGQFTSRPSWRERLFIINFLLVSLVIGYITHSNYSVCSQPSPSQPETRETREQLPSEEDHNELAYVPPAHVLEAMNAKPGLMSEIRERWGDEWTYAAELIYRESSFNPQAINPSSGACGLAQALPCEKMACDLEDVDCQLNWQHEYITKRYGTAQKSLYFHDVNGWY